MLRFLSRKKGRNGQKTSQIKNGSQRLSTNKNSIQCKVMLLDGTDLSVDLSVCIYEVNINVEKGS